MVTVGFSMPFVAKYANNGDGTVSYSEGMDLGRGVELSLDITTATDNEFYANNVLAESEPSKFTSGTATLTIDGLASEAAKMVLGISGKSEVEVDGGKVAMVEYGEGMEPPECGFGCVRMTQHKGKTQYWPYVLPKTKFAIPKDSMKTKGQTIEWQTQEMTATIYRDDTEKKNWKMVSETGMDTEREAYEVVKAILGGGTQEPVTLQKGEGNAD